MPSANKELRDYFGHSQSVGGAEKRAIDVLSSRFVENRGLWRPKTQQVADTMTHDEFMALLYLQDEWDYAYDSTPMKMLDETIAQSIMIAQDEIREWSAEKKATVQLEGFDPFAIDVTPMETGDQYDLCSFAFQRNSD